LRYLFYQGFRQRRLAVRLPFYGSWSASYFTSRSALRCSPFAWLHLAGEWSLNDPSKLGLLHETYSSSTLTHGIVVVILARGVLELLFRLGQLAARSPVEGFVRRAAVAVAHFATIVSSPCAP
jgi:hypothetical protein